MNDQLTKAEFKALVDAYLGARDHERWARTNGTLDELMSASAAVKDAREALEKGVFGS